MGCTGEFIDGQGFAGMGGKGMFAGTWICRQAQFGIVRWHALRLTRG